MTNVRLMLHKLSLILNKKNKSDIYKVLLLGFVVGLFELFGLTLLVLMIQLFSDPKTVSNNSLIEYLYVTVSSGKTLYFVLIISTSVLIFYLFKTAISVINAKKMAKLASSLYIDLSKNLFSNYLKYYYRDISKKNTGDYNQVLLIEADNLSLMISSVINLIIHLVIILMLYAYMLFIDFYLTLILSFVMLCGVFLYKNIVNHKLALMGKDRILAVNDYMKLIKTTFSNYRIMKSLNNDFLDIKLEDITSRYKKARIDMLYWAEIPRIFIELIVIIVMIGILVFIKLKYENGHALLLIVSAYALALFRMIPSLSRITNGVNNINIYAKTLDLIHTEITNEIEEQNYPSLPLKMEKKLLLHNMSYQYDTHEANILNNINFTINKGAKIAIVGESGSGKSTLMDILIGLHLPTSGNMKIDDQIIDFQNLKNWRQSISFVPQKVVLFESDIKENITLGKAFDSSLFDKVLKDSYMYETVLLKGGIAAKIGDEGVGFSGGQMQRLALARALYQDREILFLDEATSSLDEEVESLLIDNLLNSYAHKTIIAIVHKVTIAEKFNTIIEIQSGKIRIIKGSI